MMGNARDFASRDQHDLQGSHATVVSKSRVPSKSAIFVQAYFLIFNQRNLPNSTLIREIDGLPGLDAETLIITETIGQM